MLPTPGLWLTPVAHKLPILIMSSSQSVYKLLPTTVRLSQPVSKLLPITSCFHPRYYSAHSNIQVEQKSRFPGWTTVFRKLRSFPYITNIRLISRIKLYQTGFTILSFPFVLSSLASGNVNPSQAGLFVGFCFSTSVILMVMGEFFRKIVGFVYLSPDKKEVIISHLTFFGGRKDTLVNTRDILQLSETLENKEDVFWKVKFINSDKHLMICTKYGGVRHHEGFDHIFGTE